ncbi:MAG: radical SAM protein, partial [Candidatus Bathyarchaeia archaeon]
MQAYNFIAPKYKRRISLTETFDFNNLVFLRKGSKGICLNPDNGSWMIMSEKVYDFLKSVRGKEVEQVLSCKSFSRNEVKRIMLTAYNFGLCSLNGKWVVEPEYWKQYCGLLPRLLILKTTNACNLACKYCYAKTAAHTPAFSVDVKLAENVVSQMITMNKGSKSLPIHVNFHGGEPLLFKNKIIEIVERIRSHGLSKKEVEFSIQTNGVLLDEEIIEFCKKNDISISISLDGGKNENDALRVFPNGKGTFESVYNAINLCRRLDFNKISVLTTVTKINVLRLPYIVKKFEKIGVPLVKFSLFSAWGIGRFQRQLTPQPDQVVFAYTKILQLIEKESLKNIFVETIAHYVYNLVYFDRLYMCMRSPCGAGCSVITLDVNGDVYSCDCGIGDEEFLLGNVKTSALIDIITNKKNAKFRSRLVQKLVPCSRCIWRAFCMGTCTHRAYIANGTIFSVDP